MRVANDRADGHCGKFFSRLGPLRRALVIPLLAAGCSGKGGAGPSNPVSGGSAGTANTSAGRGGGALQSGGATSSGASGGMVPSGGSSPTGSGGASSGGVPAAGGSTSGGASSGGVAGTNSSGSPTGGAAGLAPGGANNGGANNGGASAMGGAGSGGMDVVDATAMTAAMGFGTNIGNTLENTTTWETGWGQPLISQAFISGIASRGIKTVRVPVAWDTYATAGVIDASKMNRVKEVVSWIEAAGMYSIVNIHWDGGWIFNESNANKFKLTADVKTKFESYWSQIATAFGAVGHKLIFEAMNEEGRFYVDGDSNKAPDYAPLNELNQLFVTTVRSKGGFNATRALLVSGFNTDIDLTCVSAFSLPNDPAGPGRLFLSIHYYTPYTFCGLDSVETWGSPATTWGSADEKATLQNQFSKLATFASQRKVPIILGEFGVTRGEKYVRDSASRVLWMESVAKAALSHGMVPVLWDTGSEISRADGSFSPELQSVMQNLK